MPAWIALDDDPTGAQGLQDVRIVLDWRSPRDHPPDEDLRFLLTNTRSMTGAEARTTTEAAVRAGRALEPAARFLLRSDSTLRGHLLEEYLGLCEALYGSRRPPLLLVPALPEAGRITIDGVHYLERDGRRQAVSETEYARDPLFGYRSARLLDWAEERSSGFFRAAAGRSIPLAELRGRGPAVVEERLRALAGSDRPAVLAPDVADARDLALIAQGLDRALADDIDVVVRCGPALVPALAGHAATGHVEAPPVGRGLLVVCGSWVPTATRQLERLESRYPGRTVELDLEAVRDGVSGGVTGAVAELRTRLSNGGPAILRTPRRHAAWAARPTAARAIRLALVEVVAAIARDADVILTKGGITSADVAVEALGAGEAWLVGPVEDGVMRWQLDAEAGLAGEQIVVPGNVGADDLLVRLTERIMGSRTASVATGGSASVAAGGSASAD
jgi:uncharacterized protein YgbK (DUF1537 family)